MAREILILKHVEIEGPGTIEIFFRSTTWPLMTVNLAAGGGLPSSLKDIEAVISLGGPMNVYEETEYPFLKDEDAFLKKAVKEEIPVLGICLGAQLLAKACGARVRKAAEKEIGWYSVVLTNEGEADRLFAGLPKELDVFQWHEDAFDIPKGGTRLAGSFHCPNQAFRFGKNAYGLQFHVEVTMDMIKDWINEYTQEGQPKVDAKGIMREAHKKKDAFRRQADIIYSNFGKIIKNG